MVTPSLLHPHPNPPPGEEVVSKREMETFIRSPLVLSLPMDERAGLRQDWGQRLQIVQTERAETHSSILGQRVWWAWRPENTEM